MAEPQQLPRASLAWLLVAQAIILVPHSVHAPLWLWAGWLWVVTWRWQIFRGAWNFPALPVRIALMTLFGGGLMLSYGVRLDMTSMVGLLLAGFILKLLELRRRRDLLLTVYLGYFVAATQFLFHSGPLAGLYGLLSLVALTSTLVAAHQSLGQFRFWPSLKRAGVLVLQAAPLMLVLFLLVPRTGALWSVPSDERQATTGVSDTLSPGDISDLAQSDALAFRVTFEGEAPPPADRYWRGLVLSDFDGRTWQQSQRQKASHLINWGSEPPAQWRDDIDYRGRSTTYEVIIEPTRQSWLYALSAPRDWDREHGLGQGLRLEKREPVRQRMAYGVTSELDYRYQAEGLADWQRRQDLSIPSASNPRTQERARQWASEADSAQALIDRLLAHYRERFRYTLQPPALGQETVDEFLWETQAGFCEHFASSFVFFLRAAGIPARVVVGYLGATPNPLEDYWTVRQRDAHAWAEVWLEGRGWTRFDPTAAVAPERVESGLDFSLSEEDSASLERQFGSDVPLFQDLRLRWDVFNYQWHRWVLNYDDELRDRLLGDWLGGADLWRLALAITLGAALVLGLLVAWIFWQQRPRYRYPADRQLARLSRKMARVGLARQRGEPARAYVARLSEHLPESQSALNRIAHLYELVHFGGNNSALGDLRKAVSALSVRSKSLSSE